MPNGTEQAAKSQQKRDWTSTAIAGTAIVIGGGLAIAGAVPVATAGVVIGVGITLAAGYEALKKTIEVKAAFYEKAAERAKERH